MKKILVVVLILLCFPPVFADDANLLEIQSIPQLDGIPENLEALIGVWDGQGVIAAVYPDRLVISDSNFYLASDVVLITTYGLPYPKSVSSGMVVYYFLDSSQRVTKLAINTDKQG